MFELIVIFMSFVAIGYLWLHNEGKAGDGHLICRPGGKRRTAFVFVLIAVLLTGLFVPPEGRMTKRVSAADVPQLISEEIAGHKYVCKMLTTESGYKGYHNR